ncbi:MAG: DUF4358 domain-containing protein [Cellulosilyticaceae bacterium]
MKLNKKLVAMMLAVAVGGSLVGCGQKEEPKPEVTNPVTPEVEDENKEEDKEEVKPEEDKTEEENKEEVKPEEDKKEEDKKEEVKPEEDKKPAVKPEVKPDPKPEVKPDPKPEVKPDPKPEVKPDPTPEVKPDPKPEESNKVVLADLMSKMLEEQCMPMPMPIEGDLAKDSFYIDTNVVEEYTIMKAGRSPGVGVIAMVKAKDGQLEAAKTNMAKALESAVGSAFYPDEVEAAQNGKVVTKGNYVGLFILSEDFQDSIIKMFNEAVK